jgi:hypothetical protein
MHARAFNASTLQQVAEQQQLLRQQQELDAAIDTAIAA